MQQTPAYDNYMKSKLAGENLSTNRIDKAAPADEEVMKKVDPPLKQLVPKLYFNPKIQAANAKQ